MRVLITFGPTYESLDQVRRLTNFSSGRLGAELSTCFANADHEVIALRGHYATHPAPTKVSALEEFTTSDHLLELIRRYSSRKVDVILHAAAVSDFKFGGIYEQTPSGLTPVKAGKVSTRSGRLLAELIPTAKIIAELRDLYPVALLVGWKYEVDGDQAAAVGAALRQLRDNRTDYCVANGPAYGGGFGLLSKSGTLEHVSDSGALCRALVAAASHTRR